MPFGEWATLERIGILFMGVALAIAGVVMVIFAPSRESWGTATFWWLLFGASLLIAKVHLLFRKPPAE